MSAKSFRDSLKVSNTSAIGNPNSTKTKKTGNGASGGTSANLGVPMVTAEVADNMNDR